MKTARFLFLFLIGLTAARYVLVACERPSPEETYYYLCAQHPAAAYFDGPAGTAAIVGALAKLSASDFLWRCTASFWALLASILTYSLGRRLVDEKTGVLAAIALNLLPVFNMDALRVGPSLPALTFDLAAILCVWIGFEAEKRILLWWLGASVLAGCAALFDYRALIVVPALAIFILSSPKHRKAADIGGVVALFVVPGLMLIPAFRWNATEEWIPMAGGTFQTLWSFDLVNGLASFIGLLYFISPLVIALLIMASALCARVARRRIRARFIFLVSLLPLALALYSVLRGAEAVFYVLLAAPLLLARLAQYMQDKSRMTWLVIATAALALILSLHAVFFGFTGAQVWADASAEVRKIFLGKLEAGENNYFLVAEDPSMAAVLGYYLRGDLIPPDGHPTVYVRESQAIDNQFGLWPSYDDFVATDKPADELYTEQKGENPFVGRNALYITSESANDVPQTIKAAFESIKLLKTYPMGGDTKEPLYIYLCLNYQTLPL